MGTDSILINVNFFPGGAGGKGSPANAGDIRDSGSVSGWRRSLGKVNGDPLQIFLPEEFHGQRSLVGYSPWGHRGSDTNKQLTHFFQNIPFGGEL